MRLCASDNDMTSMRIACSLVSGSVVSGTTSRAQLLVFDAHECCSAAHLHDLLELRAVTRRCRGNLACRQLLREFRGCSTFTPWPPSRRCLRTGGGTPQDILLNLNHYLTNTAGVVHLASPAARSGGFEATCHNLQLHAGHMLAGAAEDPRGRRQPFELDLDDFVQIRNGVLSIVEP